MASRQAVGESLRMSNTSGSAYPRTTIPSILSARTNRDCSTRSCKPYFLRIRQMTLASAGGITVAAAISCHAFHCLETASRNNSFSRPFEPSHCFSQDRAAFAINASTHGNPHSIDEARRHMKRKRQYVSNVLETIFPTPRRASPVIFTIRSEESFKEPVAGEVPPIQL